MTKSLIFVTSGYPYGKSETFIETEIIYLSRAFDNIIIFCPEQNEQELRSIPDNCQVVKFSSEVGKLKVLLSVFSPLFWSELKQVRKTYRKKISLGIFKTALVSIAQAKHLKNQFESKAPNLNEASFYSYWSDDSAVALALLKKKHEALKIVSRIHGWDVYFEVGAYNYLPYRSLIVDQMDAIFSISEQGKKEIENTWKQDRSGIIVSRLGVQSQELKKTPTEFRIVSCSNLIPLKRVDSILKALSLIEDVKIEWVHFGDGPLFNELKELSKGVSENITINWKGRMANTEVLDFYKNNDVSCLINVSTSEGVPVSIMEAMSFGVPVIATEVGGNGEIVDQNNGILLSSNPSIDEVKESILKLVGLDQEAMDSKRAEAYKTWQQEYSADKNYIEFTESLASIFND